MKRGFASWELRGTNVLTLGCGARLGLHLPLRLGLCHYESLLWPGSALHVPSWQGRAGTQSAWAGLHVAWEKVRVSKRGGGGVGTATAWSLHALGDVLHPAEVPVLALDQALTDHSYTILACNALGMSPGLAKGSLCSPHTSCPGRGHHAQQEGTSFGAELCPSPGQRHQPCLGLHRAVQTSPVPPTRTWAG